MNPFGAIASLYQGFTAYEASFDSASLLREQGALSRDDYYLQAALIRDKGSRVRSKQAMEYVSSGVEIVGTPQLVLKETLSRAYASAKSHETTGENILKLYNKKADMAEEEGQAALIQGILNAGANLL
jgi:hypothetical protein